eukprot:scaffold841_cov397-Prasinococcus_capsulatus_cf.AAC.9
MELKRARVAAQAGPNSGERTPSTSWRVCEAPLSLPHRPSGAGAPQLLLDLPRAKRTPSLECGRPEPSLGAPLCR